MSWPALAAARAHDPGTRLPFVVAARRVGSVARTHLDALRAWPAALAVDASGVSLIAAARDAALAGIHAGLRAQGLLRGWRDEAFALLDPDTGEALATMERAAARFWGTLTRGAHLNGYVAGADGRPQQLWIARRSLSKPTDPGRLDNLVGGGVPAGQAPTDTLRREAWEEAGLDPALLRGLEAASVLRLHRDVAEGLQFEDLSVFDLALPDSWRPANQDGEVAGFHRLPVAEALRVAAGDEMTVDAALVTLDFALRHGLLPLGEAARLGPALLKLAAPALQSP